MPLRWLRWFCWLLSLTLLVACGRQGEAPEPLARAKVDALNKGAFKLRYQDCQRSERYARRALAFIDDSLPQYDDGRLRAWNNIATACLHRAQHDSVLAYVDSVLAYDGNARNRDVERLLAQLSQARLKQRACDMAGCYAILYDVEHSRLLEHAGESLLYNLAISEYYITTTTLNYHYRSKSQYEQAELMNEMEARRGQLACDYAEDMSFNYALAYGYYALCADTLRQADYLGKALHYCMENLHLLDDSLRYNTYDLGNTYQLVGFMLWGPKMRNASWDANAPQLDEIVRFAYDAFGFDALAHDDLAFAFLSEATALFFLHDDPYQRLGAIVSTGRYSMSRGDTATARRYFTEALIDTTMLGVAPKFEAMLYEGFLTSGCATSAAEVAEWTRHELDLLDDIKQNEKADFLLQLELTQMRRSSSARLIFALILLLLALALLVTLFVLRRRTKALQRETEQLQAAKQQDVERIANVETCLSVLRHDMGPFVSYLQNEHLPDELRHEVTGQLIRTFENIKNWTNLSIPSGLQFRCSLVPLQQVFDTVSASVITPAPSVELRFEPTTLAVRGDSQLIQIMLRNLVNNALQHTTQGSVTIAARPDPDDPRFVLTSVADTGTGMTPDEVENLFHADKKLKVRPNTDGYGTGFGLILCRYIIKKHDDNTLRGCRIWAESVAGQGSTLLFRLAQSTSQQTPQ